MCHACHQSPLLACTIFVGSYVDIDRYVCRKCACRSSRSARSWASTARVLVLGTARWEAMPDWHGFRRNQATSRADVRLSTEGSVSTTGRKPCLQRASRTSSPGATYTRRPNDVGTFPEHAQPVGPWSVDRMETLRKNQRRRSSPAVGINPARHTGVGWKAGEQVARRAAGSSTGHACTEDGGDRAPRMQRSRVPGMELRVLRNRALSEGRMVYATQGDEATIHGPDPGRDRGDDGCRGFPAPAHGGGKT
jgi:hypothetical protein